MMLNGVYGLGFKVQDLRFKVFICFKKKDRSD